MISKIKSILINILEGKSVGTLYHYTDPTGLLKILQDNNLKPSKLIFNYGGYNYISFTRDKNLHLRNKTHGIGGFSIRLTLDGDKISNNYKLEPYDYYGYESPSYKLVKDEREERLVSKNPTYKNVGRELKDLNKYLTGITIYRQRLINEIKSLNLENKKYLINKLPITDISKKVLLSQTVTDNLVESSILEDYIKIVKSYNIPVEIIE